jgi:tRNA (cytidine/uridine-2'-O-)-methyltransferase
LQAPCVIGIQTVFHVVLFQPEIPPNTGNIIRLCANTGAALHLVGPCGFTLDEPRLRRAGLDYREWVDVTSWPDLDAFNAGIAPPRLFAFSSRAARPHTDVRYRGGDAFLFGPETRGLPAGVLDALPAQHRLRIPMRPDNRSLNLSNAVAVVCYEAWRQHGFVGAQDQ